VFTGRLTEAVKDKRYDVDEIVDDVVYYRNDSLTSTSEGHVPMLVYIFFKPSANENQIDGLVNGPVRQLLTSQLYEFFDESPKLRLDYQIANPDNKGFVAKINTTGIARHPAQLYESISCLLLFLVLLAIWARYKEKLVQGRIFSIFLIWCFGMRFLFEYLKENQEAFEASLPINMGQILSIPLILVGIVLLVVSFRKKAE
jgi:prolipoprotein diacylglyceryltransferase